MNQYLCLSHAETRLRYNNYMFRFVDDLFTINNKDILFDSRSIIYPSELQTTNTNSQFHKDCSFIDIVIKIMKGCLCLKYFMIIKEGN